MIYMDRNQNRATFRRAQQITASLVLGLLMWSLSVTRFHSAETVLKDPDLLILDLFVIEQQVAAMNYQPG